MCGIIGTAYIRDIKDKAKTTKEETKSIIYTDNIKKFMQIGLKNASAQGTCATGLILTRLGGTRITSVTGNAAYPPVVRMWKAAVSAANPSNWEDALPKIMSETSWADQFNSFIGHTRAATHGSADDNKNNHPFLSGKILGVHNGGISNYKSLIKKYALDVAGECDSEVIFALLDRFLTRGSMSALSAMREVHNLLEGWWAVVFIDRGDFSKVYMFRNGAPLDVIHNKTTKCVSWATRSSWFPMEIPITGLLAEREIVPFGQDEALIIDCISGDKKAISRYSLKKAPSLLAASSKQSA